MVVKTFKGSKEALDYRDSNLVCIIQDISRSGYIFYIVNTRASLKLFRLMGREFDNAFMPNAIYWRK